MISKRFTLPDTTPRIIFIQGFCNQTRKELKKSYLFDFSVIKVEKGSVTTMKIVGFRDGDGLSKKLVDNP